MYKDFVALKTTTDRLLEQAPTMRIGIIFRFHYCARSSSYRAKKSFVARHAFVQSPGSSTGFGCEISVCQQCKSAKILKKRETKKRKFWMSLKVLNFGFTKFLVTI